MMLEIAGGIVLGFIGVVVLVKIATSPTALAVLKFLGWAVLFALACIAYWIWPDEVGVVLIGALVLTLAINGLVRLEQASWCPAWLRGRIFPR